MIMVGGEDREDNIAFCMTSVIWESDDHQDVWRDHILPWFPQGCGVIKSMW